MKPAPAELAEQTYATYRRWQQGRTPQAALPAWADLPELIRSSWTQEIPDMLRRTTGWSDGLPAKVGTPRTIPKVRNFRRVPPPKKPVFVYFIGAAVGPVKIGSSQDPRRRLQALQTASPFPLRLLAKAEQNGEVSEALLHQRFDSARLHGEWFEPTPELLAYIAELGK